ncbi:MAG: DUF4234 domain-containing protein [Myxococcales bacterium]|jgi:hypothetical protein|nr:DUF4234 domain-containing protein [Myxococcales bacterium]
MQNFVKRDPLMVIVFSIITCGIYMIYWLYKTMLQMNELTGKETINPMLMLILSICCPPVMLYVLYVMDQTLVAEAPKRGVQWQSNFVLWIILSLLAGVGSFVACFQVQTALNQIAEKEA